MMAKFGLKLPEWLKKAINSDNAELAEELKQALSMSSVTAEVYHSAPGDFRASYMFLDTHPAFWWRDVNDADAKWHVNGYTDKIWTETVGHSNDDGYSWALEAGASVPEEHTQHYHDLRLDAYADTLEEAFVQLAYLVSEAFYDDGTEKEDTEHLTTPLMEELNEAVEKWEASQLDSDDAEDEVSSD